MVKKIKNYVILVIASLTLAAPMLLPGTSMAMCNSIQSGINSGINGATGGGSNSVTCGTNSNATVSGGIQNIAAEAVNVFSIIVGVVAVIMIIYGGFKYITSGGDSNHVSSAKNTLIYAIVGLIIVALAQLIVHYVLNTAAGISTGA